MSTMQSYTVRERTYWASSVTAQVRAVPGVGDFTVDAARRSVSTTSGWPIDVERVRRAVERAGFALVSDG